MVNARSLRGALFVVGLLSACVARASDEQKGLASWYGAQFQGRPTASGEPFDKEAMTAAHRTLPFGTLIEVKNLDNGETAVVRVNDRGPFVHGRILDCSEAAPKMGVESEPFIVRMD